MGNLQIDALRGSRVGLLVMLIVVQRITEASLDFTVVQGSWRVPDVDVHVQTTDVQQPCLKYNSATQDVLLECTMQGILAPEYHDHCIYSEPTQRVVHCCKFCCSPLSFLEKRHYAKTGKHRCEHPGVYCNLFDIKGACVEASFYDIEKLKLDVEVVQEYEPDLIKRGVDMETLENIESEYIHQGIL